MLLLLNSEYGAVKKTETESLLSQSLSLRHIKFISPPYSCM